MEFTLRSLTADDMFPMFNIISKIGIKEFKSCFESNEIKKLIDENNTDARTIGINVALDCASILFSNIGKCKDDIFDLLASLSGMSKKDIAKLPMATFTAMIIELVKKEEFADFFQEVSKLFN